MSDKLFEIASRVAKPLSLSGIIVAALYLIYKAILGLDIFGPLGENSTLTLLSFIADRLFYLALVAVILGVASYVFVQYLSKPQAPAKMKWEITGNVLFDDGHPVEDATVYVDGVDRKKQTDSTGWFQIEVNEQKQWTIRASHKGFTTRRTVRRDNVHTPITLTVPKSILSGSQTSPNSATFVIEGVQAKRAGFRVLFSIWNTTQHPIKVFEFITEEYARIDSIAYYGGARHFLRLRQNDKSTLWSGETYEIPSTESASFELEYTIDTGPLDGAPWIVFGILAHFHDAYGNKQQVPSNTVLLYREGTCSAINLAGLEALKDPSQPDYVGGASNHGLQVFTGQSSTVWNSIEKYQQEISSLHSSCSVRPNPRMHPTRLRYAPASG